MCIYIYRYVCTYLNVCVYIYMYINIFVYVHIYIYIRVVVKIMVPLWVLSKIRHLVFGGPRRQDHNFDNHPYK